MFKKTIKMMYERPAKFGRGVGTLWWGASPFHLIKWWKKNNTTNPPDMLTFESCRRALTEILLFEKIGLGDDVLICGYTCEAVPYAVEMANASYNFYDLNENMAIDFKDFKNRFSKTTKAVIIQYHFGVKPMSKTQFEWLKSKKIIIIADVCLDYGSYDEFGREVGYECDYIVASFELSKSFTVGWAGSVKDTRHTNFVNCLSKKKRVNIFADIRRCIQLFISVFLTLYGTRLGSLYWAFLYGTKLFRKSANFSRNLSSEPRLGKNTERLLYGMLKEQEQLGAKAAKFLSDVKLFSSSLGYNVLGFQDNSSSVSRIVSPKVPILFENVSEANEFITYALKNKVEAHILFNNSPPRIKDDSIRNEYKVNGFSKRIVCLPCFFTFNEAHISLIKRTLIEYINHGKK